MFLRYFLLIFGPLFFSFAVFTPAHADNRPVIKIAVFGDSIFSGRGLLAQEDHFENQLTNHFTRRYRTRLSTVSFAYEGMTSTNALRYVPQVLDAKPDMVIVHVGVNDAMERVDPDIVYNNLDNLLLAFDRAGIYTLLVAVEAPDSIESTYSQEFNQIYPRLAARYRLVYFQGIMNGIEGDPSFTQEDRFFPNKFGVTKMIDNLSKKILSMMRQIKNRADCMKRVKTMPKSFCEKYLIR